MRSNNKQTPEELEKYIQLLLKEEVGFQELKNNYSLLLKRSLFMVLKLFIQALLIIFIIKGLKILLDNKVY